MSKAGALWIDAPSNEVIDQLGPNICINEYPDDPKLQDVYEITSKRGTHWTPDDGLSWVVGTAAEGGPGRTTERGLVLALRAALASYKKLMGIAGAPPPPPELVDLDECDRAWSEIDVDAL